VDEILFVETLILSNRNDGKKKFEKEIGPGKM
jgi:hypothetical protein